MRANRRRGFVWGIFAVLLPFAPAAAQSLHQGEVLRITRAVSPVRVDGALDDEAWKAVQPVQQWYQFNPGDNVAPKVESVGYLSFDDRFLYAGVEFSDPDPKAIRAPYARVRSRDQLYNRRQFGFLARFSPSPQVAEVQIDATAGTSVDFTDSRPARARRST
jgi:hypothetical protein